MKNCLSFTAGIKVAVPCPSKPFTGFGRAGQWQNTNSYITVMVKELAGLNIPQGKLCLFYEKTGRKALHLLL